MKCFCRPIPHILAPVFSDEDHSLLRDKEQIWITAERLGDLSNKVNRIELSVINELADIPILSNFMSFLEKYNVLWTRYNALHLRLCDSVFEAIVYSYSLKASKYRFKLRKEDIRVNVKIFDK